MKKAIFVLIAVVSVLTSAFGEIDPADYHLYTAIPARDRVMGYDKPGFYLNMPRKVESFYFYNDVYWKGGDILEVSQAVYTRGDQTAPFIKIRTKEEEGIWVFGGDVIIAALVQDRVDAWYERGNRGRYMQIFLINGRFYLGSSSWDSLELDEEEMGPGAETPFEFQHVTSYGETSHYVWDRALGGFKVYYRDEVPPPYEEPLLFRMSGELHGISKIMTVQDEWFWHFFNNNDFDALLALKSLGYDKFDSPWTSAGETPLFISRDEKNYDMIKFLIENGYGQTAYGGNYDATISCLWAPIGSEDYGMVRFLLESGAGKNLGGEMGTEWDLGYALRRSTPEMVQLLIDLGYDAARPTAGYSNGEDSSGSGNFLFNAIYWDDPAKVKILLEAGANENFLSQEYGFGRFSVRTPLEAAKSNDVKKLLLAYGAKTSKELTSADFEEQRFGLTGKMNDTQVRYRSAPGLEGEILGHFEEGEPLMVMNISGSYPGWGEDVVDWPWLFVRRESGEYGWVYGQFVDVSRGFSEY